MTFAIVIPNLNQSGYLVTALKGLRLQKARFKVALMDGGSEDGVLEAIQPYRNLLDVVCCGKDGGQSAAIADGLKLIPGEIVTWLNADDYYYPDTLAKVERYFDRHRDVDVVYGDAVFVTNSCEFISYYPSVRNIYSKNEMSLGCVISQPACFVRREWYDKVGGVNRDLVYTMDWDLWCRLIWSGARFHYLPDVLAAVRCHPQTKTMSGSWKRYREIYKIERRYNGRFPFLTIEFVNYDVSVLNRTGFFWRNFSRAYHRLFLPLKRRYQQVYGMRELSYDGLLYGFDRWAPFVNGACDIHIPWYREDGCRRLRLHADPPGDFYSITVNGVFLGACAYEGDSMVFSVPYLDAASRNIHIEKRGLDRWIFKKIVLE